MKDLLIIGTGNFSKVVKEYAARCEAFNKDWQIKGFLISDIDENRDIEGIVGDLSDYQPEKIGVDNSSILFIRYRIYVLRVFWELEMLLALLSRCR